MLSIYDAILQAKRTLAILIDPEKTVVNELSKFLERATVFLSAAQKTCAVDHIIFLVGGSTMHDVNLDKWLQELNKMTKIPIVIFPGSSAQLSEEASGLLFLNLLSGNNPDYLINQQRQAAAILKNTHLEIIPTAYLLLDGGTVSAVQRVSATIPLAQTDLETIVNTAYAGQLMGNKLVYLEAGSGAKTPVSTAVICAVSGLVQIPVLVGGGIRTFAGMEQAFTAGAHVVVVGTAIEDGDL